jgi:antitoxin component of MazEF toxin-antitoxin module
MTKYESKVLEILENGDAILELPDDLCKEMGWNIGDELTYEFENDQVILKKVIKSEDKS